MKLKRIICMTAFSLCLCPALKAQQIPADTTAFLEEHGPTIQLIIAGEATLTTYGGGISFPVFWIENRVKLVPLVGIFWEDLAEDASLVNPALGAKILYFFDQTPYGISADNSFYAGVGGMSSEVNFLGRDITERSRVDVILGYNYIANQTIQLAPELYAGVNSEGEFRAGVGFVIHFGY